MDDMESDIKPLNPTTTVRISDRDLVVTRTIKSPARIVYAAWTKPKHLMQWWAPKSFGITFLSCEVDAKTDGKYRFVFGHPAADAPMAFFGTYIDVIPNVRLVWTNEESADGAVSTVTFTEKDKVTLVTLHEIYPSKAALDDAITSGSNGAWPEQFDALEAFLEGVGAADL